MNVLFVLFSFLFLCEISYSDIIPPHSHLVDKCVKIINTDDFPDYCFLAYIVHPTGIHTDTYIIDSQTCLHKGYKFNTVQILAVKKEYFQGKDLHKTDWLHDEHALHSTTEIDSYGGYVDNSDPTSSINEEYKIANITTTSVLLYKCREYIRFINGHPASIRNYNIAGSLLTDSTVYPTPDSSLGKSETQPYIPSYLWNFLIALLYTIAIETIVLVLIFKTRLQHTPVSYKILLIAGILCSFTTLPYVWFVVPYFIKPTVAYMLVSEISVITIESLLLYKLLPIPYQTALGISTLCNLSSFVCGLLMNFFLRGIV